MSTNYFNKTIVWASVITAGLAAANAWAAPASVYPLAELGGCRDAKECFLVCEIPANAVACWYWDHFEQPRVRQASSANETVTTVTIDGQVLSLPDAADYCAPGSGHEEACLEEAQQAGIDISAQLPEGYKETAAAVAGEAATADSYNLVRSAVQEYESADRSTRERYQALALNRLPEEHFREHAPRYAAIKRLKELAASRPDVPGLATALTHVTAAEQFCQQQRDLCYEAAREAGLRVEHLVRSVPAPFIRKFTAELGLPANATPRDLKQAWETLAEGKRAAFITEYSKREAAVGRHEEPEPFLRSLESQLEQHGDKEMLNRFQEARQFKEQLRNLSETDRQQRIAEHRRRLEGEEDQFKVKIEERRDRPQSGTGEYEKYRQQFKQEEKDGGYRYEERTDRPTNGTLYDKAHEGGYPLPPKDEFFSSPMQPPPAPSAGETTEGTSGGDYHGGESSGGAPAEPPPPPPAG